MTGPVSTTLATLLREHLKYLAPNERLDETASLKYLGLDSMAIVTLTIEIEDEFGVTLSDRDLVPETFGSLASLSSVVERTRRAQGQVGAS